MTVVHSTLTGSDLHFPLGHQTAGALVLPASAVAAYRIETAAADSYLEFSTNSLGVGNYISLGNTTDNPRFLFAGSGPWAIGGAFGSAGDILVSGGSGTNPDWTTAAGDVTGSPAAFVVGAIQGNAVETGTPANGDTLVWSTANAQWEHVAGGGGGVTDLDTAYDGGATITADSGAVTIAGTSGFTVSGGPITFSGSNVDFDPTGTFDVSMDASQQCRFIVANSYTNAFQIVSHGRVWFEVSTGTGSAGDFQIGNATDTPSLTCQVSNVQFTNGSYDHGVNAANGYRYIESGGGGANERVHEQTFRFSATGTGAETIFTAPTTLPSDGVGWAECFVMGIYNNGGTRVSSVDKRSAHFESVGGTVSLTSSLETDSSQDNAGSTDVVLTTDGTNIIIQGTAPDAAYEWSGYVRWQTRAE